MNHLKYLIYCNLFLLYHLWPCMCVLNFQQQKPILDNSITCHFTACDIMLQLTSWDVADWLIRYNLIKLWMFACKQSSKINDSVQVWSWWALLFWLPWACESLLLNSKESSKKRQGMQTKSGGWCVLYCGTDWTLWHFKHTPQSDGNTVAKLGAVSQCSSLSTNTKLVLGCCGECPLAVSTTCGPCRNCLVFYGLESHVIACV